MGVVNVCIKHLPQNFVFKMCSNCRLAFNLILFSPVEPLAGKGIVGAYLNVWSEGFI
jgi:hypothetical protein